MPMTLAAPSAARAIVGNRNHAPLYYQPNSAAVLNQRTRRTASRGAAWSSLRFTYCGFYQYGGEFALTAPFTLRASVEYLGRCYPLTFGGSRDYTFSIGRSYVESDPVEGLLIYPGTAYYERTRRAGKSGDNALVCADANSAFGEWSFVEDADYTLGGEPGGPGAQAYFTISGGTITGLTVTAGGSAYTGTYCPVYGFDPDTGAASGGLVANLGLTGGAVPLGTRTTGLVNTTGWGPNSYPVFVDVKASVARSTYHASLVTGVPSVPTESLILVADSNGRGFGASDLLGDAARNYGIYERWIRNRVGVGNLLSYPGAYASSLVQETVWPLCHAILDPITTRVLWQAAGNDIGAPNATAGAVINSCRQGAALWRGRGAAVSFATPIVRTDSSDGWTTTQGQTPRAGFEAGGPLDAFTYAVRNDSAGLNSDFGFFEARAAAESTSAPNVWRVDGGASTLDGSHPSAPRGLRIVSAGSSGQ